MALSVMKDSRGPDWPLGFIKVVTPGTKVSIMSLVDAALVNSPNTIVPPFLGATPGGTLGYAVVAQQVMFQAFKPGVAHGLIVNVGNIYIIRVPQGAGSGDRDDYGAMVMCLTPGQTIFLAAAPQNMNTYSPYRYFVDADNADDGALVTLFIG